MISVFVPGNPAPQGSKRAFRNKHTGRIHMKEDSERTAPWREDIRQAVLAQANGHAVMDGPLTVAIDFVLPRPKGHWRTGRNAHLMRDSAPDYPAGKPDLDKLVRAVLDAVGSTETVWRDDAQVVRVHAAKTYPQPAPLDRPGALIRVQRIKR